jgi:hypothetical protein
LIPSYLLAAQSNHSKIIGEWLMNALPNCSWVGFNILGGLTNQLNKMGEEARSTPPESRSVRRK